MTNKISVESLSVITFKDTPVVTSELLAVLYGADSKLVRQNYLRNTDRFIEGKHFYKLTGSILKEFKVQASKRGLDNISPKVSQLLLWTERGAARHAKMLETDQAWNVFEKLEDYYFNSKSTKDDSLIENQPNPIMVTIPTEGRWLVAYRNGKHQVINVDGHNVVNVEYIQKLQRDSNLLIELLQDYRRRTQVLQGDKSGDILNIPLIK
ncbi:Phage anti-repressor protein [Morganella morganii]|uniref:ORF6N domain-containing protein n=1 Tax=Morganella morganii TaxID=582 RepID=UPI000D9E98D2|nr:ORF6N domain-containing protein [Morganella morganii]SPX94001.1 Phage anti-repressor protein [Morganella morganii]